MRKCIIVSLLIMISLTLFGCQHEEDKVDGNFIKPAIYVHEKVYWLSADIQNTREIADDFKLYGKVTLAVENSMDLPTMDLQVTKIMNNEIGSYVYLSREKDLVAIFNEDIHEFVYYE